MRLGGLRVIKALRLKSIADVERCAEFADVADFLLVDAFHPELYGGGGNQIDQELLRAFNEKELWSKTFLAGGLKPENVKEQIEQHKPFGVDVASGVESAPGEKSVELMSKFISAAKGL
jgi:phosphoribosylanthranilate isomerase